MKQLLLTFAALATAATAFAQPRITRSINDGWTFEKEGKTEIVDIPHTWNAHDTWDDEAGYYRGLCTYSRKVRINDNLDGKSVYVRFEGANQVCELVVNGQSAGKHAGGYTAFIFDITGAVRQGDNDFLIKVDNSHDVNIPPLSADFTFYGGIYRDVDLVITSANHICNTHFATNGVYITTPVVGETSTIEVKTKLSVARGKYQLTQEVFDPCGKMVASSTKKISAVPEFVQRITLKDCKLWDVDTPNVYRVVTTLRDSKGRVLDAVENPMGLRTFSFDVEKGFTLNGRPLKIVGTNRHQDYCDMGNGLSDEMHVRDVNLLKEMGGNFLRIAHYPQDPIVTQLCDRYGIVCSVEIPIVNYITESKEFGEVCLEMAREMVYQNYNNPSVIIWAYMNEVLLRPPYLHKEKEKLPGYYASVAALASAIDKEIKSIDGGRYTMIPCHADPNRYHTAGLTAIPDILGWNFYSGWYSNKFEHFDASVEKIHNLIPDKPFILSEYGAGVDPRVHSRNPLRFDFSVEYGMMFHKHYLDVILSTPYIAGSNVWNLNDFYAENRVDAVPHVNNKGLVGLDRVPKDTYRYYQARLLKTPFLAIGGKAWPLRGGNEGETQTVEVYSNASQVTFFHNGNMIGTKPVEKGCASFAVTLTDGDNVLAAEAEGGLKDAIHVKYSAIPTDLRFFKEMNVSLGGDIYLQDEIRGAIWIPEQEYKPGSWGYVGGASFQRPTGNHATLPSTDADIFGTLNNPIFQTQRVGLESFKADVPDGQYYVYLYFAEIAVNSKGEPLPYNLGNDGVKIKEANRSFSVSINGTNVLDNYNIKEEHGACRAAIRKFTVDVAGGKGLSVDFSKIEGAPVLNAIRVYRCM